MLVSIDDAGPRLDELVSRVESGDEVVLTRDGRAIVRLAALGSTTVDRGTRRTVLEAARARGRRDAAAGEGSARSQDFLYSDDGTPG